MVKQVILLTYPNSIQWYPGNVSKLDESVSDLINTSPQ